MTTDTETQFKIETKRYLNFADIDGLRVSWGKPEMKTVIEGPLELFLNDNDPVLNHFLLNKNTQQPTNSTVMVVSKLVEIINRIKADASEYRIAFAVKKSD